MDHLTPIIDLGGFRLDLSTVIMIVVTSIIVLLLARAGVRNASVTSPTKMQNFMEWVIEFVSNIISTTMDLKKGRVYLGLGITLIMYIFVGNLLGLPFAIATEHHQPATFFGVELAGSADELAKAEAHAAETGEESHGLHYLWWKSPTANASVTMALAIMVIVLTHIEGIRRNAKHYFKHFAEPFALFLPLNLIKVVSNPLSLGLRLYGNIFAGEMMIAVIIGGLGFFGIPALIVWQGFSIFIGSIQAFVFVMLTMVYMQQNIIHEEH